MSDITEKIIALRDSFQQCITDSETQADKIASLENTNKRLIQQHGEEIEKLKLKLTGKDKELSEVTVENTTLHSSIEQLRKRIENYEYQLRTQCKSVTSLESINSALLKYHGENSQLKLQLTKKDNELSEVVASKEVLSSELKCLEQCIIRKDAVIASLMSVTSVSQRNKELKKRDGEIKQLRLKLTETRQKLREEEDTKKYEELPKSSTKAGLEQQMSNEIGGHGKEDNPPPRKQRKIESCGVVPVVSSNREMKTVIIKPHGLEETQETSSGPISGSVMTITSEGPNSSFHDIPVTEEPDDEFIPEDLPIGTEFMGGEIGIKEEEIGYGH